MPLDATVTDDINEIVGSVLRENDNLTEPATDALIDWALKSPKLLKSLLDGGGLRIVCSDLVRKYVARERRHIHAAVKAPKPDRNDIVDGFEEMNQDFSYLDFPVIGGRLLGDCTPDELMESGDKHGQLESHHGFERRWQHAVANAARKKHKTRKIRRSLTDEEITAIIKRIKAKENK